MRSRPCGACVMYDRARSRRRGPRQVVRRRACSARRLVPRIGGRAGRADRAERRRQDDLLQLHQRPAEAGRRPRDAGRHGHHRPLAARDRARGRGPHVPGRGDVRIDDRARERGGRAALACRTRRSVARAACRSHGARRPMHFSIARGSRRLPSVTAPRWRTATSSASSSRWRLPATRSCCSWTSRRPAWRPPIAAR